MDIKPLDTEDDDCAAPREIESLMSAELGTIEADRLDILATLVDVWEATSRDRSAVSAPGAAH
ncbi:MULTISPECIES: hypothetical protein [unclassified Janthinobacterium]|uniref:hypothetical protein n=1 Tax=unclassified Janthinobacterium TaxID=2610881 RepID=UPI0016087257|nr:MULTISPECIES: hypothetical protein [unclassified Janthinobacterium]MBB5606080.1 antitoxin component HigA of HigAB toxin-antitoxin module [Janthinobacterium sp. S3T4]MBB5616039.1 antitoxin component HigA of HigAB toxin-antitoxin module [Janthinobacterium sp. S3M3]